LTLAFLGCKSIAIIWEVPMRVSRLVLLLVVLALSVLPSLAQQVPAAGNPQAIQLLQRALSAITKGAPLQDITLTGTARRIAGSDDETGAATLKAVADASRIDLNLSSGPRSEIQNSSGGSPAGTWSGPDGVAHAISFHNLLTDPAWFFPAFPIARGVSGSGYLVTYVGQETRDSQAVEHVTISQTSSVQTPSGAPTLGHLSQMDFFLDSTTFLPAAVTFNIHPDNDAGLDIPIEVRFSDYRVVNGVQVPFHVQKFLNNGLVLDLQFNTAVLNTGLAASQFQVQ
jgi:hypothetical protein